MDKSFDEKSTKLIVSKFELDDSIGEITEEQLLIILADRIAWMIEYNMDFLLSLMYRLDVLEKDINKGLSPGNPDPANMALAKLVLERQKLRIKTREMYRSKDFEGMEDWDYSS